MKKHTRSSKAAIQTLVDYEAICGIAKISINRPEQRNALNLNTISQLISAFKRADRDSNVRCIVLSGKGGKSFCAGADLSEMVSASSLKSRQKFFSTIGSLITAISSCRKVTIAQIEGYCLAGGCGIVAACDLAVATTDSTFGLPELRVGLAPMVILAPLSRVVAPRALRQMALTARPISAQQAKESGLITEVVERSNIGDYIKDLCGEINGYYPEAIAATKKGLVIAREMPQPKAIAKLSKAIAALSCLPQTKIGIRRS